jgi:DNA primase
MTGSFRPSVALTTRNSGVLKLAPPSLRDRIAFLMSIKEEGKAVSFNHVVEKVTRDLTFLGEGEPTEREYRDALSSLVKEGLLLEDRRGFYRKGGIDAYVGNFVEASRESLNRSYYLVYAAERYYPSVVDTMLPYLLNRPLSAVKVFSGKKDPIREVEPIFVRYSKYKPRPVHLTVTGASGLMSLVHDHCVDFVPYVHGFDGRADIFLVDLDLGDRLASLGGSLALAGHAASIVSAILTEKGCHPLIKFSGSRGFQVLCHISREGKAIDFASLRDAVRGTQVELEARLQAEEASKMFPDLGIREPFSTSSVDKKSDRSGMILVDWSSMKPEGDYRAPLSLHHKTGLVSLPLAASELDSFRTEDADPLALASGHRDHSFVNHLKESPGEALSSFEARQS